MSKIYTIGSSIHTVSAFISLLYRYKINAIADVRSVPYSQHTPQFNKDALKDNLKESNICYLDFSNEFGAKRTEKEAYTDNCVDFSKVMNLPIFLGGIDRINTGISKGYNVALLCTEKDPLDCHRFSLVSRAIIEKLHIDVYHILFNGDILNHQELEKMMLRIFNLDSSLLNDELECAYRKINKKIAFQN